MVAANTFAAATAGEEAAARAGAPARRRPRPLNAARVGEGRAPSSAKRPPLRRPRRWPQHPASCADELRPCRAGGFPAWLVGVLSAASAITADHEPPPFEVFASSVGPRVPMT